MLDDLETVVDEDNKLRCLEGLDKNPWSMSNKGKMAIEIAKSMAGTKTGLAARIPIVCKADNCPYSDSCALLPYDMAPLGDLCPIEIAQIEALFSGYTNDIPTEDLSFTDQALINEIVMLDIMIERCKGLMSKNQTPVVDMTIGITENGREIKQPGIDKAIEAYEKLTKRKDQKLQLLHMTRTDRIRHAPEHENKESWIQTITANITQEDLDSLNK